MPGRTHPLMTERGGAEGYVFTAFRAKPAEGHVEAMGKFGNGGKRKKTAAVAAAAAAAAIDVVIEAVDTSAPGRGEGEGEVEMTDAPPVANGGNE